MSTLVLLRHGQSVWNLENRFTGWWDVPLSDSGRQEARAAGAAMKEAGIDVEVAHTSLQTRAIHTLQLALEEMGRMWVPVRRSWRLNERHYGGLTGLDKAETAEKYGADQVKVWRRSYATQPPVMEPGSEYDVSRDPRYRHLPKDIVPRTECLADVVVRMLPYWYDSVVADLVTGSTVLVAAHGNSLRALIKHLEAIPDEEITELEIPTGVPMVYTLDGDLAVAGPRQELGRRG
jgi:2,3-bisphosphoglycerate-dependent phosphoglycerate mutase